MPHGLSKAGEMPRRVLEAELVHVEARSAARPRVFLRDVTLDPLAPCVLGEAGKGRIVLVPFDDQLFEVARPLKPHLGRGVRLDPF